MWIKKNSHAVNEILFLGIRVLGEVEGHHGGLGPGGGGLPGLPGLYGPGGMAGMLAQFQHESLLNTSVMQPPNIPQHDLSSATADEVLEAAMAGQLANLHHSLKRPSHTSYDTNSDMDFDLKKWFRKKNKDNI